MRIDLAFSAAAGDVMVLPLTLPAGATLADALAAGSVDIGAVAAGIWGRQRPLTTPLRNGDRIELYRPLRCDPKQARRERVQQQRGAPVRDA